MQIYKIHDLSNTMVNSLLQSGLSGLDELAENYSPEYSENNANLFYILEHDRYLKGAYYVLEHNGEYVASAGWNEYDTETAIVLSRSFVSKKYRTTYPIGTFLLPAMIEECKNYPKVWITCNEYNKTIYNWFERSSANLRPALFNNWPEIYRKFTPIGTRIIYHTEQYIVQFEKDNG